MAQGGRIDSVREERFEVFEPLGCNQWDGPLLTKRDGVNAPEWCSSANHSAGEENSEVKPTRAGIGIEKSVFHVHAVDRHDRPQWQAKLERREWIEVLCDRLVPGAEVGMEAYASAHRWAREIEQRGSRIKLIAAQFVKPSVKGNKNDRVDAAAICEAMGRPGRRLVTGLAECPVSRAGRVPACQVLRVTAAADPG